jgi:hypothetical protein
VEGKRSRKKKREKKPVRENLNEINKYTFEAHGSGYVKGEGEKQT